MNAHQIVIYKVFFFHVDRNSKMAATTRQSFNLRPHVKIKIFESDVEHHNPLANPPLSVSSLACPMIIQIVKYTKTLQLIKTNAPLSILTSVIELCEVNLKIGFFAICCKLFMKSLKLLCQFEP